MSDLEDAIADFLEGADAVYHEYERGYMDADAALSVLEGHVDDLREEFEG